jgi:excisionase family DNA binding protein
MSDTITIPRLMTVREVADALRCSRSQAYALIYAGTIPTTKVAGKTLCRAMDVEAYITSCLEASGLSGSAAMFSKPTDTSIQTKRDASDALSQHRRNKRLQLS